MREKLAMNRRSMLALTGKAGMTTLTAQAIGVNLGLVGVAGAAQGKVEPFRFAIISDPHLYSGVDHVFDKNLEDAVAQVNGLAKQPDFVIAMGDVVAPWREGSNGEGQTHPLRAQGSKLRLHPRRTRLVPGHGRCVGVRTLAKRHGHLITRVCISSV